MVRMSNEFVERTDIPQENLPLGDGPLDLNAVPSVRDAVLLLQKSLAQFATQVMNYVGASITLCEDEWQEATTQALVELGNTMEAQRHLIGHLMAAVRPYSGSFESRGCRLTLRSFDPPVLPNSAFSSHTHATTDPAGASPAPSDCPF
jgi:hypothetical protein